MKWEKTNSSEQHESYRLTEGEKTLLTLTLQPFSNAIRVECKKQQQVFLVRKEGFLKNKTVLRNEYGVRIGELGQHQEQRFIELNGERFFYQVENNPLGELVLFKERPDNPLVRCGLKTDLDKPGIRFSGEENLMDTPHPGLLMALCWYLFLPVARENVAEYAH